MTDLLDAFGVVFGTIFVLEIVDRTNFGVISLATRHRHVDVWTGAAMAFVVSTLLAVAIGWFVERSLAGYVEYIHLVGGVVLVAFGAKTILENWPGDRVTKAEEAPPTLSRRQVVLAAFSLVLLLEMGDNTQILTILLATEFPWEIVLVAAALALCTVSSIGAFAGHALKDRVPGDRLERALGVVLVVVGGLTILAALDPALFAWA